MYSEFVVDIIFVVCSEVVVIFVIEIDGGCDCIIGCKGYWIGSYLVLIGLFESCIFLDLVSKCMFGGYCYYFR